MLWVSSTQSRSIRLTGRCWCVECWVGTLAAQSKPLDECPITLGILLIQVPEQPAPATHHLEQTTSGMMIVRMIAKMLGQRVDPFGQKRDLNLGRAGIGLVPLVLVYDLVSMLFLQRHPRFSSLAHP